MSPRERDLSVTISVEWGYELHSLKLSRQQWAAIRIGDEVSINGDGYDYEGEFFEDRWIFNEGEKESLRVEYGDDGGEGFNRRHRRRWRPVNAPVKKEFHSHGMIIHVPHSDPTVPDGCRDQFELSDPELKEEILHSTDWFTDELFGVSNATTIRFPISRIVVDPERFAQDEEEAMSQVGRGVVYRATTAGRCMRRAITPDERQALLDLYYHPHHKALTHAVAEELRTRSAALIIDAHSFPNVPWQVEPDQTSSRPDFCIGTDPFHTPAELVEHGCEYIKALGYSVAVNQPYAGAIVPLLYYRLNSSVVSIMIEVNRRLYMDEITGIRPPQFTVVKNHIIRLCQSIDGLFLKRLSRTDTRKKEDGGTRF